MTNENSPLTDRPSRNLAKALVAVLVILTGADLVLGGLAYFNERQKCLAAERNLTVLSKLTEITQTHLMLCRISAGKQDEVMRALKVKLSTDILSLDSLLTPGDDETRELARKVCWALARGETRRLEHHPGPVTSTGFDKADPHPILHAGQPDPPGIAQQ